MRTFLIASLLLISNVLLAQRYSSSIKKPAKPRPGSKRLWQFFFPSAKEIASKKS